MLGKQTTLKATDDLPTINGLESELIALRHQYAEQSDELATAQTERDALMALMTVVHDMLSEAGVPLEGKLTERVKAALGRMQKAERRHRRSVQMALMFRRRWIDACAEIACEIESEKPARKIVEWLRAAGLYPTDIFETSDPYTIYASFGVPLNNEKNRRLSDLNLRVIGSPLRNRYMIRFVPSLEDEV